MQMKAAITFSWLWRQHFAHMCFHSSSSSRLQLKMSVWKN